MRNSQKFITQAQNLHHPRFKRALNYEKLFAHGSGR